MSVLRLILGVFARFSWFFSFNPKHGYNNYSDYPFIFYSSVTSKSKLVRFISDLFEPTRSKKPSKQLIYKSFYDMEESTREVVKDLVIEMLNKTKG